MSKQLKKELREILEAVARSANDSDFTDGRNLSVEEAVEELSTLINQKEKELLDKFEEAIERVETQIGFDDGLPSDLVVFNQGQRKVIKQLKEELKEDS